jgi:hypothetical protein
MATSDVRVDLSDGASFWVTGSTLDEVAEALRPAANRPPLFKFPNRVVFLSHVVGLVAVPLPTGEIPETLEAQDEPSPPPRSARRSVSAASARKKCDDEITQLEAAGA